MKVFQAIFLTLIPFTYSKVIRPKDEIQQLLSEFPHMTVVTIFLYEIQITYNILEVFNKNNSNT